MPSLFPPPICLYQAKIRFPGGQLPVQKVALYFATTYLFMIYIAPSVFIALYKEQNIGLVPNPKILRSNIWHSFNCTGDKLGAARPLLQLELCKNKRMFVLHFQAQNSIMYTESTASEQDHVKYKHTSLYLNPTCPLGKSVKWARSSLSCTSQVHGT